MQKQLEGTQKYIMSSAEIGTLPYRWATSANYCEQYTRASSGV